MASVGDTIVNCRANANSINDDHADKSTNFKACHKQSRSLRDFDCWNQGGNFGSAKSAFSDRRRQFFRSAGIRSAEPSIFVGKIGKNRRVGKIGGSAESGKISQIRQANHNQFNDAT
ncbi:unnamed protein product [Oikopleura dioica]|uniref:Uncharacterized protein n=1 Tax=Oikopleura dioica TaxID=34765 RepID=E4YQA5_OIKDI|nr:unnamed protein product [Oikopleura dioica]